MIDQPCNVPTRNRLKRNHHVRTSGRFIHLPEIECSPAPLTDNFPLFFQRFNVSYFSVSFSVSFPKHRSQLLLPHHVDFPPSQTWIFAPTSALQPQSLLNLNFKTEVRTMKPYRNPVRCPEIFFETVLASHHSPGGLCASILPQ